MNNTDYCLHVLNGRNRAEITISQRRDRVEQLRFEAMHYCPDLRVDKGEDFSDHPRYMGYQKKAPGSPELLCESERMNPLIQSWSP